MPLKSALARLPYDCLTCLAHGAIRSMRDRCEVGADALVESAAWEEVRLGWVHLLSSKPPSARLASSVNIADLESGLMGHHCLLPQQGIRRVE